METTQGGNGHREIWRREGHPASYSINPNAGAMTFV